MSDPSQLEILNCILVVDDEPQVLRFATSVLSLAGYSTQVAADGMEGLDCFYKHRHELCLVVTDIMMPKMNGIELALAIRRIDPLFPILLSSGYSDTETESQGRNMFPFLRKPFLASNLLEAVRSALGK